MYMQHQTSSGPAGSYCFTSPPRGHISFSRTPALRATLETGADCPIPPHPSPTSRCWTADQHIGDRS